MRTASKHISLYWRFQLIGWTAFTVIVFLFNYLIFHDPLNFIPFAISIFILGLLSSHAIKIVIKNLRIFRQGFIRQIVSLLILTILFSLVGTMAWMLIMIGAGFWKLDLDEYPDWWSAFLHGYFFNLFPVMLTLSGWVLIYFLFHYVRGIRREERLKLKYRLEKTILEARALRAQMNPHFVFNCMNSIKALILDDEKQNAVDYLTTFSKLIRTLFQNSGKRQITLHDEIETCKLYMQLEGMRLNGKLSYNFEIASHIDLKSVMVPALIIQPFIENAIWHGIVPKNGGQISVKVDGSGNAVICIVDDNGIGREMSKLNKPITPVIHESKGVHLSQARLNLEKMLNETYASIDTIDKYDAGTPAGTRVIITFNLQ